MIEGELPKLTFILGGARSGKSAYAEKLAGEHPAPRTYIATAQGFDDEMRQRISEHQRRRGANWVTVEAPLGLVAVLRGAAPGHPILVDCLTIWLTNVMLAGLPVEPAINELLEELPAIPGPCIMVSNEVGLGIVPENALARSFRDYAGRLHQRVAAQADRVIFMVAGYPMVVKP